MRYIPFLRRGPRGHGASLVAACALAVAASCSAAQAQKVAALPSPSEPVAVEHFSARPLAAWTAFCEQWLAECAVDMAEPERMTLTKSAWQTIVRINRQVNASIEPMSDLDHWGETDRWDFAQDGYGDCEDYQLVKRRMLVQAGLPHRAMRMTVVLDENGEGHAVLMIRTDRGEYILDNKHDAVLPWRSTGYIYVKRESAGGEGWASLGRAAASPAATAGR